MLSDNSQSFKLVIKPGDKKLKNSDYWAVFALCVVGAFVLLFVVGNEI